MPNDLYSHLMLSSSSSLKYSMRTSWNLYKKAKTMVALEFLLPVARTNSISLNKPELTCKVVVFYEIKDALRSFVMDDRF